MAPAFALHKYRDPADRNPQPDPMDIWLTQNWVAQHMSGLIPEARFKSTCLAALPADNRKKMYLDFAPPQVPNYNNVVIFSAGWAFKYVPLIGRICADLVLYGRTSYDITPFKIQAPVDEYPDSGMNQRIPF